MLRVPSGPSADFGERGSVSVSEEGCRGYISWSQPDAGRYEASSCLKGGAILPAGQGAVLCHRKDAGRHELSELWEDASLALARAARTTLPVNNSFICVAVFELSSTLYSHLQSCRWSCYSSMAARTPPRKSRGREDLRCLHHLHCLHHLPTSPLTPFWPTELFHP